MIAGHKRPVNDDRPKIIEETRQYIRDFGRIAETTTARELYEKMLELYGDRVNWGALWSSVRGQTIMIGICASCVLDHSNRLSARGER